MQIPVVFPKEICLVPYAGINVESFVLCCYFKLFLYPNKPYKTLLKPY